MKKIGLILSILVFMLVVVACKPSEETVVDQDPVISGAVDKTINRGDTFVPLQGITATDEEDGDLTDDIVYTGNVNPNVAGSYEATYSVTDSAGNLVSVTITITVVIVDEEDPLISGAGDVTIMLGDTFDVTAGVTANDTIDGDLTEDIVITGEVNVWVPGVYDVTYTVEDEAGNEATRVRKVTVSLGYFVFGEDDVLVNGSFDTDATGWLIVGATESVASGVLTLAITEAATLTQDEISGGVMNTSVADFTLAKLVINAKAGVAQTIIPSLSGTTASTEGIELTTEFAEYVYYFRMSDVLTDEALEIDLGTSGTVDVQSIALYFGVPSDDEDPVITAPETDVVAPVNDEAALMALILKGVSAVDNIDGNITSSIEVDLTGIDITVPGTVEIPLKVSDNAGNDAVVNRTVHLNLAFDTEVILDPTFDDELDPAVDQWGLSGGGSEVTLSNVDGNMVLDVINPGGWDSATSPFLRNVTTDQLVAENWYMFKFDVKADKARQMRMRAGLELWSDPWIEDFQEGAVKNLQYQVTTDWQTIYYIFYIDAAQSADGSKLVKFEIKLGTITWGGEEKNNKIYIDNAQFYLLSMEDAEPVISPVMNKQTTFGAGEIAPDWKTYVTIFDNEDGEIAVTDLMIDATDVNMAAAGEYDVVYTVVDSGENEVVYTLTIKVLATADTTVPVLTVDEELPITFDQFDDVEVDLIAYVSAEDDTDGVIVITSAMIDDDGFNIDVAGVYEILYTVYDTSMNESTVTVTLTVVDKEGPVISGASDITIVVGEIFDPLAGVTAVDNVDGDIDILIENVTGHDVFINESNVAMTPGEFDVTYTVEDLLGNVGTKTITVTVLQIEFDEELETDLLALEVAVQNDGSVESTGVYNEDGSLTVTYNGVQGWYGSSSKITYASVNLLEGRMYKLVVEAKADTARDVLVRFVGADDQALEAFTGRKIVHLGADFAVYEFVFSLDKTGPYNIQLQFGWESNLVNASAANVMYFKQFKLVPEMIYEYDETKAVDFLALETPVGNDGGDIEATGVYNEDGSLTVTYNGVKGWWGSYSKITFYQSLLENKHYKLVIEAKAETARDILIRFADGASVAVPGFENRRVIALGTDYEIIEIEFVGPSTGQYNLQIQFGWEDFLTNAQAANVIDIKQFKLVPQVVEELETPVGFMIDAFDDYENQAALDLVYTHRVPGAGANHDDTHITLGNNYGVNETKGVKFMIGEHAVTGWDIFRTESGFDKTGLTDDYDYFAFWYKGDPTITALYVWLYWDGSQDSKVIDVSDIPAEGGYIYMPLSLWSKTATQIQNFGIGYNHSNTTFKTTIFLDNFMFVESIPE